MGREIRMVPPNWDHPVVERRNGRDGFQPMYNRRFDDAAREWKEEFAAWERGERPSYYTREEGEPEPEFWEYNGAPPDRKWYRPWSDSEATWYQVWETVSEGTPVSPPFATQGELIDYLVENGDFWDQSRRKEAMSTGRPCSMNCDPWTREQAERFVRGAGWMPSGAIVGGEFKSGRELVAMQSAANSSNSSNS